LLPFLPLRRLFVIIVIIIKNALNRELTIPEPVLSQAVLDHFKNMKRLHTLEFLPTHLYTQRKKIPDAIITVAGEVPNLNNYGFPNYGHDQKQFIDEFGKKYPQKELLVKHLMYAPLL
jgi:hypothetical protein